MTVTNSKFSKLIEASYTSSKGVYYFFKNCIVSEVYEDKHFDFDEGQEIMSIAKDYYGDISEIGYISNRINNYSLEPTSWLKFFKTNMLKHYSVVTYNLASLKNAQLEKMFVKTKFNSFNNIEEAINWSLKDISHPQ